MSVKDKLTVRPIEEKDIPLVVDYWHKNDEAFLEFIGVDVALLPGEDNMAKRLKEQIATPINEKKSYAMVGDLNGVAIGHCNLNPIKVNHAFIHLHIWDIDNRRQGFGSKLVNESIKHFFDELPMIEELYAEPHALNIAPNRTLHRIGFHKEKHYITTPGDINFEQEVFLWSIKKNVEAEVKADA
jgi:RimJ/RimL family protein N-acetyltransferase